MAETVHERFELAAQKFSARPFLHAPLATVEAYGLSRADYAYHEARAIVDRLAAAYRRAGVLEGARVGLAFDNRPEFFLHFLAVNAVGGSIIPLNAAAQVEELRYQIAHGECALIIAHDSHRALMSAAGGATPIATDILAAAQSLKLAKRAATKSPRRAREAALLYTSGTTGAPKGCILSNDYFLAIGDLYLGLGGYCAFTPGEERIITPLPVTHMNALACSLMATIDSGGCLIQLDRFHPKSWWRSVRESGATIMHYLGVMPAMLLNAPETPTDNLGGKIKFAFGAGCDPRHHEKFETRFGVKLIEAWAMTETGAGAWITASREPRHVGARCFGKAPSGLECMLVDEQGAACAPGEPGELLVRRSGPDPRRHFFSGYFKDEAAYDEAWKGGWFHTGDVVSIDADGNFYFVDRRKNVIRRSGENISSIEIESVIMRHPGVASCAVGPAADDVRGEEVAALIVPAAGAKADDLARSVFEFAREQLTYFKAPGYIGVIDKLPMTASEKIKRGDVKKIVAAMIESGQCLDFRDLKEGAAKKPAPRGRRLSYDGVVVAAPVTVPYVRFSRHSAHWWIGRALRALSERAGLQSADIDGLSISSFTLAPDTAVGLTQHFGLSPRWLDHIPMGGASGIAAMRRAARAVQAGDADLVACIAGDANHVQSFRNMLTSFSRFSQDAAYPYGSGGPNGSFALLTSAYMDAYGATREDFAKICVAQRQNALSYPHSLFSKPLTVDEYINARPIADPVHLYDCVMPCAGAEAFLVMREEAARAAGLPFARIRGTIERHNAFPGDPIQLRGGWAQDASELWAMADVAPDAIDFLQTYDDYPVISMMQIEDLGFCAKGEAKDFVRSRSLTVGGDFPHNTSGGQLSVGQAGAAGGYLGLVEAVRQLTGETLGAKVEDARYGAVSGFGMINYDRGLCSAAAILEAGGAIG